MKKVLALLLAIAVVVAFAAGCNSTNQTPETPTPTPSSDAPNTPDADPVQGNFTDEMKIPYGQDISPDDGADGVPGYFTEREGDHAGSPYFSNIDPYNMTSTDTLTILPKYKTIQQSSEWSCGVAAALTAIDYLGKLGDYDELTLAELRPQGTRPSATTLDEAIAIFDGVGGFELVTSRNFEGEFWLDTIQDFLAEGMPILICWNDWHGHWQVIIGYDTMGTEIESDDVIIVADPYDTTDHNQDGYGVYGAERFIYNFTMYNMFGTDRADNDMLFIAAKPAA
ncbi:MAG: hypothetical protein LBN02_09330 [Oscillospiraceae bacterium]|jgi:hypothetical protein|nr:hypothetical protein [Oscillospiraceae bacterium]